MTKSTVVSRLKKVRAPVETETYEITPEDAALLLETNTFNRPLVNTVVENYAREMLEGRWRLNGETISFSRDDKLLNGQHRLNGIIRAGIPVRMQITRNVDPDAFSTMDTGKKRTAADVLGISGISHSHRSAAAMRCMLNYRDSFSLVRSRSNQEVLQAFRDEPELELFISNCKNVEKVLRSAVSIVPLYVASRFGGRADDVEAFIDGVTTGAMLANDDPRYIIRERMRAVERPDPQIVWNLTAKALNAFLTGKTMKALRPDRDNRGFYIFSDITAAPRALVAKNWGK